MKVKNTALSVLLSLGIAFGFPSRSFATTQRVSKSDNGVPISDSSVFPAISSAVGNTAMVVISTAPFLTVYGVILTTRGTAAGTDWLILYGTGSISGPGVSQTTLAAVSFPGLDNSNDSADGIINFNPPLRANGLSSRATACGAGVPGWCYTILYDPLP